MSIKTKEPQYQSSIDIADKQGLTTLGLMTNQVWHDDPKRLTFVLARYKWVSKMFAGKNSVLEVGCADAFGTRIVQQAVRHVTAVDFDPVFVEDAKTHAIGRWWMDIRCHDMNDGPVSDAFDGVYALDVIEHIPVEHETDFVRNMADSLGDHGVMILGTPSIQSQAHASPVSKEGHINCKDADGLKALCEKFFHNVFIFSMNDEVVHTGFYPMAHYLFALCCNKK